ncbi:hypothetical protein GGTG_14120 [Gaeumannomyces tritici R3-111a-1]|uniref:Uncharacterized protein n=1 Tax=Gaeumannomyces tritici (strain R3-111a-1) TaxID=644352 RepID=J3PKQ5_GAET3|nr:hypothetical protein GGTG_14120 [Gaeumannomyces tritici R3-111a-1]EJT68299.1 hypothetical protein GGTG_14120 [Gaeumannomyces tritici R3-111a-1]
MTAPPHTPSHSRNVSAVDSYGYSPAAERRQSRGSLNNEPLTPLRHSFNNPDSTMDISAFASGGGGLGEGGGGIGNLADELAGAFSDEDEDGEYYDNDGAAAAGVPNPDGLQAPRDSGVDVDGPKEGGSHTRDMSLSIPQPSRGHRRAGSEYDGSEYGSDSDLDSPGMPPGLVAKIDAVESLARRGTETTGGATDGVFHRVTDSLRDLGSQTGVEQSTTRLITAHTAVTTHLQHSARQLQGLSYSLFAPMAPPPDADAVDELLPVLAALSESMPRPATSAHGSLAALHVATADLVQTLNYLSDTLAMSRQTTNTAARRLKGAKEVVAEMRREEEEREEGERWIARGDWSEKLRRRECAAACNDVVGGFEEVCNSWRARILAQAEAAPAPA